jgi:hypothetical protein
LGASIAKAYIYIEASLGQYKEDGIRKWYPITPDFVDGTLTFTAVIITAISIWNLIEVQVGIIAACGPTLRHIMKETVPRDSLLYLLRSLESGLSRGSKNSNIPRKTSRSSDEAKLAPYLQVPSAEELRAKGMTDIERMTEFQLHVSKPSPVLHPSYSYH